MMNPTSSWPLEVICSAKKTLLTFREGDRWTFVDKRQLVVGPAFATEDEADRWHAPRLARLAEIEAERAAAAAARTAASAPEAA